MPYKDINKKREWQRNWNAKKRVQWKKEAINKLGGSCVRCGYSESTHALHIDHIKPQLYNRKQYNRYNSGGGLHREIARGNITLDNLQLLCANCHMIKTYEEDRKYFKSNMKPVRLEND